MPFVLDSAIKWDLFISYAHVDDLDGWVDRFHKQLSVKLDKRGGRAGEIQIWRDPKLDEATIFDHVIKTRVEQSAVFLALCSNGYRRSEYCRSECEGFRQRFGDAGLRAGERSRIVRVRLHKIPYDELPGTSDRTGAFDFFTAEGDDDIGTPLETDSAEFRAKVDRLSGVLFRILENLRKNGPEEEQRDGEPTRGPTPATGEVFLAEVCDAQRKTRERLDNDLAALKVTVASQTPPPFTAAEHERAVQSALAGCKLAVHLFDECQDRPIQGRPDTTYGREQLRLVRARKVPQLIWISQRMPPGQTAASSSVDAAWLDFLDELENAKRDEGQYQVVRCPRSELAAQVEALVSKLRPPTRPPRRRARGAARRAREGPPRRLRRLQGAPDGRDPAGPDRPGRRPPPEHHALRGAAEAVAGSHDPLRPGQRGVGAGQAGRGPEAHGDVLQRA